MRTHVYRVTAEHPSPTEGWYALAGRRYGPFASPEAAELHLLGVVRRWRDRARQLGGDVQRRTAVEVVVTLPDDAPVEGAELDGAEPITRGTSWSPGNEPEG